LCLLHAGETNDTARVLHLISAYQRRGHEIANLDPLGIADVGQMADLEPSTYGFTDADWERPLQLGLDLDNVAGLMGNADVNNDGVTTLHELVDFLQSTYCGSIGVEYSHITDIDKLNWLRSKIEVEPAPLTKEEKTKVLTHLGESELFEGMLATKFNAAKRFGLEGCESMIPGLKAMTERSAELGVRDVIVGMAHRGRLNVLTNVMGKPREVVFSEFKGSEHDIPSDNIADWSASGDVKYHLGMENDFELAGTQVHMSLLPNPSHLECVNPLVIGKARSKMYYNDDEAHGEKVLPIVIHGDAAVAGQGIVYETLQMGGTEYYHTGGTVNVVCNNQIGFTADPHQSRSTRYASDVGKGFSSPIFHVNADDVEAVVKVFQLAAEYRAEFHTDVWVDLIGYRRFGHNEIDEPTFTQPLMYKVIKTHPSVTNIYTSKLVAEGSMTQAETDATLGAVNEQLKREWDLADDVKPEDNTFAQGRQWLDMKNPTHMATMGETGVAFDTLTRVAKALYTVPESFNLHRTLKRAMGLKKSMFEGDGDERAGIDWATGEALAIGTLLLEDNHVRISGQDVERGTFSHRQALVHDQENDDRYIMVNNIDPAQEKLTIHNSPLSEFGVLGFELGYSMNTPKALVIWEAQFGDFVNGAQIIIDQFISSMEAKWMRQSGLVMLLPHGAAGQGPEHTSCRIERFLQCCDEDPDEVAADLSSWEGRTKAMQLNNWSIINATTPANYFHALRRQQSREFRKPLVVASPKDLLRHKLAVSQLDDFGPGTRFHRFYHESHPEEVAADDQVRKVVLCSGKIYYELLQGRREKGIDDVVIGRVEQLTPFPFDEVAAMVAKYPGAEVSWVQEEPKNMGFWAHVQDRIHTAMRDLNGEDKPVEYVGRRTMASPAEGYGNVFTFQQAKVIDRALS
jgi:2-oxoglutarate dehydrogenase E1 component